MLEKPAFIQGVFTFEGRGLASPGPFPKPATYTVPADKRAQTIYFRAGNAGAEMICLVLTRSGKAMRYFRIPIVQRYSRGMANPTGVRCFSCIAIKSR